ncbi:hypothetical protein AAMO2058_000038700 [Amorphochlora amoebiformis]
MRRKARMVAAFAKHMRPWPPQVPYKQAEHELITHLSSDQQPSGKANGIEREKEFKENMAFKNWASEPRLKFPKPRNMERVPLEELSISSPLAGNPPQLEVINRGRYTLPEVSIRKWVAIGSGTKWHELQTALANLEKETIPDARTLTVFFGTCQKIDGADSDVDMKRMEEFFSCFSKEELVHMVRVLPKIVKLSYSRGNEQLILPVLSSTVSKTIDLSRREIAFALANIFLSQTPRHLHPEYVEKMSQEPSGAKGLLIGDERTARLGLSIRDLISGKEDFEISDLNKFRALISYFDQIYDDLDHESLALRRHPNQAHDPKVPKTEGDALVTFHRRSVNTPVVTFDRLMRAREHRLSAVKIDPNPISQKEHLALQTCFSSPQPTSHYFASGRAGQEEMMLSMYPEALMLQYIMDPLEDHEAAVVIGLRKYTKVKDMSKLEIEDSLPLSIDTTPFDIHWRQANTLVFIDAVYSFQIAELGMETLMREVVKAYAGFSVNEIVLGEEYTVVATGLWGGGHALGDPQFRFMLQWAACSIAGREMQFHSYFQDDEQKEKMELLPMVLRVSQAQRGMILKDVIDSISDFGLNEVKESLFATFVKKFGHMASADLEFENKDLKAGADFQY